jgi:Holliday junction resolvase RusA-like endonuclease
MEHYLSDDGVLEFWSQDIHLKSKPRPRLSKGRVIMPREYMDWKKEIKNYLLANIPQLYSRKSTLYGSTRLVLEVAYNNTRADADNAVGGLMDAFNEVVWDDDRQVMELHVYKMPKAELTSCNFTARVYPQVDGRN